MHRLATSFVLGYHGCSAETAAKVLKGENFLKSENDYDWLGRGVYFWEANPRRGLQFYREQQKRLTGRANTGTVVGAIIELGFCLDLLSSTGVEAVQQAYRDLKQISETAGTPMPVNSGGGMLRNLDCAVINHLHESHRLNKRPAFDTVRGMFAEGKPAFDGSGIAAKSHIQIAVCNLDSIKGAFRVPRDKLGE